MSPEEIQAELEKYATASGAAASAADSFAKALRSGEPNWDAADKGLRMLTGTYWDSSKKIKSAGEKLVDGLKSVTGRITSGLRSIGSESESGAKAIKNITDSVGGAISDFAGQFGFVGKALGTFSTAITGATGLALGFVDELESTNKKIGEAGVMFGDTFGQGSGIDELAAIIEDTGLSMGIFNKVLDQSESSLRLFTGGTTEGIRRVTSSFKKLRDGTDGQYESIVKLGYSTEDIMEGMADFGAAAKLAGKDLNMDQLADGTTQYLKMQRELTRLTGTSVKDAKAKAEALTREAAFQSYLEGLEPAAASAVEQMLASLPESQQEIAKAAMMGYQILDPALAYVKSQVPEFQSHFEKIGEMAKDGSLNMENVKEYTADSQKIAFEEFKRVRDQLGGSQMLGQYSQASGLISQIVTILGNTIAEARPNAEAAGNIKDTAENVSEGMGDIARAFPEVERASIALRSALFTTGAALTTTFAPILMGLTGMVNNGAKAVQESLTKYTAGMNRLNVFYEKDQNMYATEEDRMAAGNKIIAETFGSIAGDGTMMDDLFTKLGSTISNAIYKGFADTWKELNPGQFSSREANEFEKTPEFEAIKEALKDVKSGAELEKTLPIDEMIALKAYLDAFSGDELNKRRDALNISEKTEDHWYGKSTHLEKNAFGNIINPKPSGQIIRVAEAGMPELVAPATRGPGGKLGLEISGTHLDNSRLLQSLAESGKNQVNVMASVSSKMNELVANMEKFARAQEQANRLAS